MTDLRIAENIIQTKHETIIIADGFDDLVALLDPFNLDHFFSEIFVSAIESEDVSILLKTAVEADVDNIISQNDQKNAMAATRDLGMIASAMTKMGYVIHEISPILEAKLTRLSSVTGEVPRDTVYSYGPRNPRNERLRTYTNLEAEKIFIESFRSGMEELSTCISSLECV
jgi:hypothetical protein